MSRIKEYQTMIQDLRAELDQIKRRVVFEVENHETGKTIRVSAKSMKDMEKGLKKAGFNLVADNGCAFAGLTPKGSEVSAMPAMESKIDINVLPALDSGRYDM
jgi:hypothetical protein